MTTLTTPSLDERLAAYFRGDPIVHEDPYPLYRELRETSPIHHFGPTVIVSSHAEAKTLYRDIVHFNKTRTEGLGIGDATSLLSEDERKMLQAMVDFERLYMSSMNGETHRRVRNAAQRAFTPKRIAELGDVATRVTGELLDDLETKVEEQDGAPDIFAVAYRIPLLVIMELLGAPFEDADRLKAWGDAINGHKGKSPIPPETVHDAYRAKEEFTDYVEGLIERQRLNPTPTALVTSLLDAENEGRLQHDELVATMVLLLFAGHETTANLIGNGLLALLTQRDQWVKLCSDISLAPRAVEELLRFDPSPQMMVCVCVKDTELLGVPIAAGQAMMMLDAAANRDPDVFPDPDRLEIERRPNDHLSLGFGTHFCLGAPLARLEGRIVFEALASRYPELRLAERDDAVVRNGQPGLRGLHHLRVDLGLG